MTAKVMFSFLDQLVIRERSKVLTSLLEKEVIAREQSLYLCAKELEDHAGLKDEMATWHREFGDDGLRQILTL